MLCGYLNEKEIQKRGDIYIYIYPSRDPMDKGNVVDTSNRIYFQA